MSRITKKSRTATFESLEARALFSATPQVIGYLPDYEFGKFITVSGSTVTADTMAWKDLNQVNYFSLEPNSNGTLKSTTSSGFNYSQQLPELIKEASNNGVLVNITVGGGDAGSIGDMTALVRAGQSAWTNFAASLKSTIATETAGISNLPAGGVGVDLDYEPVDGSISSTDVADYGNLIKTIHQNDPSIRLSAAVLAAKQGFTDTSITDYALSPTAVQNLNSINVMDYQLDPTQAPVNEAESYMAGWSAYLNSSKDALTGTAVGGHNSQLNFGVPFYGVGNNGSSFATYPQILGGTRVATTANYIETNVNGTDYYSDSPTTLAAKVSYAKSQGFGGLMAWELGQDALPESGSTSLLTALKTAVGGSTAPTTGSVSGTIKTSFGAPLANVTVYLDANNNGKLDTGELHAVTSSTGTYSFSNVPVHAYTIRQSLPTGDTQTSPASNAGHAISVTAGSNFTGENFTDAIPTGAVSGSVKTATGAAIPGVTVYLDANNNGKLDAGELTATTTSTGSYSFSNVPVHAYTVRQSLAAGYTQTSPTSNAGHALNVVKGSNFTNENFTDTVPAASTKLPGTIIAAAVSQNSTLKNAFDGILSTEYHSSSANGNWIGLDLGSAMTLTQIKYAGATADPYYMEGGVFQASNSADFSNAVTLYTIPNTVAPSSTTLTTVNLTVTTKYRYVRYVAPGASYSDLGDIQFFGHA